MQPFPNASGGKWLISTAGGVQPHWSRDGTGLFYFAGKRFLILVQAVKNEAPPVDVVVNCSPTIITTMADRSRRVK